MLALLNNPHVVTLAVGSASTDPLQTLINYGLAGVVIILLVTGQLRTKSEVLGLTEVIKELREEGKQKDLAVAALIQQITTAHVAQIDDLTKLIEALPSRLENDRARDGRG